MQKIMSERDSYQKRFRLRFDEFRWLYMELYDNGSMFAELCSKMEHFYRERRAPLKERDRMRMAEPEWYKNSSVLGMMIYAGQFAGSLAGVREKLGYIQRCQVNCLHLFPVFESPEGHSDGGFAVSDFRKIGHRLGTARDLDDLTDCCHRRNINVSTDFVLNQTSNEHEWARRARSGEGEYMSRYYFFDNADIPRQYEETVPQEFPVSAPGNFTYVPECGHYVMTSFYPYEWDLNYHNPRVFNEMVYNCLFLANRGIDVIRLVSLPFLWKEPGTSCRNLPQVHTIVRLFRIITEIVCPSVVLLGEAHMKPQDAASYFGTVDKPECHMLYNVETMPTAWHTVATRDATLMKRELDTLDSMPKRYVFVNYLRCHDDVGWSLDYDYLGSQGIGEASHKKYLNDFFRGYAGSGNSRGTLYNEDYRTGNARFCGSTASMCGIERAGFEGNDAMMDTSIELDIMIHAFLLFIPGLPVLYSGDEIGQVNDYSYRDDPKKAADSRYIHRGKMKWELVEKIGDPKSVQGRIFSALSRLERIRGREMAFREDADTWTMDTRSKEVLGMGRCFHGDKMIGIFNFSEHEKTAWINETDGLYRDLITGEVLKAGCLVMAPYGFHYLKRVSSEM